MIRSLGSVPMAESMSAYRAICPGSCFLAKSVLPVEIAKLAIETIGGQVHQQFLYAFFMGETG
jgi:hypothetical protein